MSTAFILASLVLALTPGPGVLFVVTRTLAQGRAAGLASVAGVALGNLGNALGACFGLAALLAVSSLAFDVLRLAGALVLVVIGIRVLRAPAVDPAAAERRPPPAPLRRLFRDGFAVALLNPKTLIFFTAFLPPFIDPAGPALPQALAFGAAFVAIAAITDSGYVLAAGALAPNLSGLRLGAALGRWTSASIFVGLGVYTALSGQRPVR